MSGTNKDVLEKSEKVQPEVPVDAGALGGQREGSLDRYLGKLPRVSKLELSGSCGGIVPRDVSLPVI